jgi:FHS family glucose/mannose:H+ symporter-like MFS transporter
MTSSDGESRFLAYSYAAFTVIGVITTMLGALLPLLSREWHLEPALAGTLFSWQFGGATLGTLFSASQVSRRSFRPLLIVGLVFCISGVAGLAWLSWPLCRWAIAGYGFGLGICIPTINLAVLEATSGSRVHAVSVLNSFWTLGAVVGPIALQGVMNVRNFLWGVTTALALLILGGLFVWFPASAEKASDIRIAPPKDRLLILFTFAALFFFYVGIENAVSGWIAFYSVPIFHNEYKAMTSTSIFWFAFWIGRLNAPILFRGRPFGSMVFLSVATAILGITCLFFSFGIATLIFAVLLIAFGLAAIYPIIITSMAEKLGAKSPAATLCFAFSGLGAATLPFLAGLIGQQTGNAKNGLIMSGFALVLIFCLYSLTEHTKGTPLPNSGP